MTSVMETRGHRRLREWFGSLGVSVAELSRKTGVDSSYLSRLLAGNRGAGIGVAVAIEKHSADWSEGPIAVEEWVAEESADSLPPPPAA